MCVVVVAPFTTLVIVHSGCCYAEDTRGTGTLSRESKEIGSEVFSSKRQTSNCINSQTNSLCEKNSTSCDLMSRAVSRLRDGVANRIIGGTAARIEEFPFVASLFKRGHFVCSMCIITHSWLLIPGHCTLSVSPQSIFSKPTDFTVTAGSPLLITKMTQSCFKDEVIRDVDYMVHHPDFLGAVLHKDMALMHISRPLQFNDRIQPAPLPARSLSPKRHLTSGSQCLVPGWSNITVSSANIDVGSPPMGRIKESCKNVNISLLKELKKVTLAVITIKDCLNMYPWAKDWLLEEENICTNSIAAGATGVGDSGAPLVCSGTVVGLVSWGLSGEEKASPAVFTRIDRDMDWILTTTHQKKANLASPPPRVIAVVTLGQIAMALASICHA